MSDQLLNSLLYFLAVAFDDRLRAEEAEMAPSVSSSLSLSEEDEWSRAADEKFNWNAFV